MKRAILFGAAESGKQLYPKISEAYEILGFTDNDSRKWGSLIFGKTVYPPGEAFKNLDYNYIIITSLPGMDSIIQQCCSIGIPEGKIITSFVKSPLESRIIFLECLSRNMAEKKIPGACAEAGVFQGDFAKHINRLFPQKKLYLFDTFQGFPNEDLKADSSFSKAKEGDYCNAEEAEVLKKMEHPEKCIIQKGYFPKTAIGIEGSFCFVNLDMDLYKPTSAGLHWFGPRMEADGVILVHDYFSDNFRGPKNAVDEYLLQNPNLISMPIGDGISIAIAGFGGTI